MNTTVRDIFSIIDSNIPFSLAEDWDNSGLQAGNFLWSAKKILVSLDITMEVMNYASAHDIDMIISHHPLMFSSPKKIDFNVMPGSAVAASAQHKISIVSAHTNLDKVYGGINDRLAVMLGLNNLKPFIPSSFSEISSSISEQYDKDLKNNNIKNIGNFELKHGIGRIGKLNQLCSLKDFALSVKEKLKLNSIRVIGDPELCFNKAAVCSGSGGSLIKEFIKSGASVYVTGDIKYHEARDVEQAGLGLIDIGHFASEHISIDIICEMLERESVDRGLELEIEGFYNEKDPFVIL